MVECEAKMIGNEIVKGEILNLINKKVITKRFTCVSYVIGRLDILDEEMYNWISKLDLES